MHTVLLSESDLITNYKKMKNKGRKIGIITGGILGLLVGISAIINFPPYLGNFYQVFLGDSLQWIVFKIVDPILGANIESSGWVLLPILMGVVGAIYGYIVVRLFQLIGLKKN